LDPRAYTVVTPAQAGVLRGLEDPVCAGIGLTPEVEGAAPAAPLSSGFATRPRSKRWRVLRREGFADTHAPAISMGEMAAGGTLPRSEAAMAILVAFSSNTVTKIVLAFGSGGRDYGRRVLPGLLAMIGGAWLGWWGFG
jgi:hypothetical protein